MGCGNANIELKDESNILPRIIYNHNTNLVLHYHNIFREKHNTEKLTFSTELYLKAKSKLLQMEKNNFNYNSIDDDDDDNDIGENLFITEKNKDIDIIIKEACETWYNEKNNYNFNLNQYQKETGHFTQMIWKNTKEIGSGYLEDKNGQAYFLVLYSPIGNEMF